MKSLSLNIHIIQNKSKYTGIDIAKVENVRLKDERKKTSKALTWS